MERVEAQLGRSPNGIEPWAEMERVKGIEPSS
jgi:hypothetical protein